MSRNFIILHLRTKLAFYLGTVALLLGIVHSPGYAQTKIGVQGGVNFANIHAEDESHNEAETKSMAGVRLGLKLVSLVKSI